MPNLYNFEWLHKKAKEIEFGEMNWKVIVHGGMIIKVFVLNEIEGRNIEESHQRRQREDLI